MKRDLFNLLQLNRQQAIRLAGAKGRSETLKLFTAAQEQLSQRLRRTVRYGAGQDSFTAAQLRTTMAQINLMAKQLEQGMREVVTEQSHRTAERAVEGTLRYMQEAEAQFAGVARARLGLREATVIDSVVNKTDSTQLRRLLGTDKADGILGRYSKAVIKDFEKTLQMRFLAGTPWSDVREELTNKSKFLQSQPLYWAERIMRTEVMYASNKSNLETMKEADEQLGGVMLKILAATFDNRTAADSWAVHGQIRRASEAFDTWYGSMQHPPARPNDREVVVPHNQRWPIPPYLAWKSDAEVAARWNAEGHKKAMPRRPKMTTVPLNTIGQSKAS